MEGPLRAEENRGRAGEGDTAVGNKPLGGPHSLKPDPESWNSRLGLCLDSQGSADNQRPPKQGLQSTVLLNLLEAVKPPGPGVRGCRSSLRVPGCPTLSPQRVVLSLKLVHLRAGITEMLLQGSRKASRLALGPGWLGAS